MGKEDGDIDGDELASFVGWADGSDIGTDEGDELGTADGDELGVLVGLLDGSEDSIDRNIHSPLSWSFVLNQQHLAVAQIVSFSRCSMQSFMIALQALE